MVEKITKWLYLEPLVYKQEFTHLTEISRNLKKNHSVVRQYLNLFEKDGILEKTRKGRLTMYKIKISFPLIIDYTAIVEKEKLINKCRKELVINELVDFLHKNLNEDSKALIFGSAAVDSKKANDIDLLVTGKTNLKKGIANFEKKFNVNIHIINANDLKSLNEGLRKEIMSKHLIIQGSEEIIKWLI